MRLSREKVKFLIIHQSATPKIETSFEKIKKFHLRQGMGNIAYHYFIEADGKLRKGRNESSVGTHTKAGQMNLKSLGICLAGEFNREEPNPEQLETLAKLLNFLSSKYQIPKENILAHNEVPGSVTECPGINLNHWLVKYRDSRT